MNMILQIEEAGPLSEILKVGGVLSLVLAIAVVALWKDVREYRSALAELNAQVRKDATENVKIIDALTNTINRNSENDGKVLAAVTETLAILKNRSNEKL